MRFSSLFRWDDNEPKQSNFHCVQKSSHFLVQWLDISKSWNASVIIKHFNFDVTERKNDLKINANEL